MFNFKKNSYANNISIEFIKHQYDQQSIEERHQ